MLPLEALLLASMLLAVVMAGRLGAAQPGVLFPAATSLLLVAHLFIEKPRWQMVPLYLLAMILVGSGLAGRPAGTPAKVAFGLLLAFGAALPLLAPLNSLPRPSGPYPVGSLTFDWSDPSRPEIYSPGAGSARRITVQVWYPAEMKPGAVRLPYHPDAAALQAPLAKFLAMPPFILSHLGQVRTHSYAGMPVAVTGGRFPVLVFSHGWRGMRVQNTYQVEELASHGYVVFSADHTFGAIATVFSDGQVVGYNPAALPGGVSTEEYDRSARQLGQSWSGDIRFIIDQAARLDAGELVSPLTGRLDLAKTGVFGHSTGGGAAIEACWLDVRCQAGLVMDAWMIPYDRQIPVQGLQQPFMFMFSETWSAQRNQPLVNALLEQMRGEHYRLTLTGTQHMSFSDMPLFLPLLSRLQTGSLFSLTPQQRINAYSLAFFDQYLKGPPSDLLQPQASPLRGVTFSSNRR